MNRTPRNLNRRFAVRNMEFLPRISTTVGLALCAVACHGARGPDHSRVPPNVVLLLADDQGWGDLSLRGHPRLETPHLDAMAADGLRFDRFYASSPVCSPTRFSMLTGRHPFRGGVRGANHGHLRAKEETLAELLLARGYRTGFFGKWHLGTLTTEFRDSNRGGLPKHAEHFAPPAAHGFQAVFATEAKVPTCDPMRHPTTGEHYGTHYFDEHGEVVTEGLDGDDSRIVMERALGFVRAAASQGGPFFAVIWFHAPHLPVVVEDGHREGYADVENLETREYYACLSALDEQVGRLRTTLAELGVAENTLVWYASDNGPESTQVSPGSTGGLRGRKRSLYEGGVRVPGLVVWPAVIEAGRVTAVPGSTLDVVPTVRDALGLEARADSAAGPVDGVSLRPLFQGVPFVRPAPIGFRHGRNRAWIEGEEKLVVRDDSAPELYDLASDPEEARDLAREQPDRVGALFSALETWSAACDADAADDE